MTKKTVMLILGGSLVWFGLMILSYHRFDLLLARHIYALKLPTDNGTFLFYYTKLGLGTYNAIFFVLLFLISCLVIRRVRIVARTGYLLLTVALAGVLCDVVKVIFGRMRPSLYFRHHEYGFSFSVLHRIHHSRYESFPSGHSTISASVAVALLLLFPKLRIPAILFMFSIAVSRVLRLDHYLSDVMAGMYIGTMTSLLLYHYVYLPCINSDLLSQRIGWLQS
ncbi:MAG: hypothetical protein COB66_08630 [Coxiella sp. (in: Bacteria)]|nr:MAG: hypothetical protein COB66_08630 [Coxiella sp. (in: g-proteobacteria)]